MTAVRLSEEAREVALAEAQAVLAMVQDEGRRDRLAALVADVDEGEVEGASADALEELLELGLATGRLRALYGPGGEQAALLAFRKLPRGAELAAGAREVTEALPGARGQADRLGLAGERRPGRLRPLARGRRARPVHSRRPAGRAHPFGGDLDLGVLLAWQTRQAVLHGLPRPRGTEVPRGRGRPGRAGEGSGLVECGARGHGRRAAARSRASRRSPSSGSTREYEPGDLEGRFLVIAATSDEALNRRVFADAEARGLLCNVADVPELCSFILPAVHREGPIAVAVSTGGASPALAQLLRSRIAAQVGPKEALAAERLRALRPWAKRTFPTYEERRDFFQREVERTLAVTVSLVGAGPGDPGPDHGAGPASACARCEVLVYDRLVRRGARRRGAGAARFASPATGARRRRSTRCSSRTARRAAPSCA